VVYRIIVYGEMKYRERKSVSMYNGICISIYMYSNRRHQHLNNRISIVQTIGQ